ncbi:MAG: thioredoxin domain-containing protein [Pyrinomonadaceae bacterium]
MQSPKKYTNHLINETSPYLLQHAHNPVDWYPWGEEAFAKAKAEDKPVLVSIGYSACHWCHVMEHESFEDEAAAKLMNDNFVSIKVDMEERPDVDQIYMTFVQLTTGRGGWPMNVFLTPDKLPFFGGTYFPPVSRYNMPSWSQILTSIAEAWREKRSELLDSANDITGEIRRVGKAEFAPAAVSEDILETAFASFVRSFDAKNGGFGGAPKFPPSMSLDFLLRYWKRTGNENALEIVKHTAAKMANGGINDQLGGGFHRYAVDAIWLVPHFEKMLYDNAQLIRVYLHLYQIMKKSEVLSLESGVEVPAQDSRLTTQDSEFFKRVAVETLEYVKREMLDSSGGFYSSQDADSEGVEGKFFVWTVEEITAVLGEEDAKEFCAFYDVTAEGNFEETNILNVKNPLGSDSGQLIVDSGKLVGLRKRLFDEREKRIKPFRDEKVLTAWNGLMLAAFAEAAAVLGNEDYLQIAKRNADFLLENLQKPDREEGRNDKVESYALANAQASASDTSGRPQLLRTWKDGRAKLNGYIEDYANLADGLIELYQVSGETKYLLEAKQLADTMITEFWDEENGGFFFTSNDHEELIVRNKDFYDNATPAGNSVAAAVLLKLAKLFGEEKYERFAATVLRLVAPQISRHPHGFGRALSAIEFYLAPVKEVVIVGEKGNELEREVFSEYLPNTVVVLSVESGNEMRPVATAPGSDSSGRNVSVNERASVADKEESTLPNGRVSGRIEMRPVATAPGSDKRSEKSVELLPLLLDRKMIDGKVTAYICENFVCQRPVTSVEELREQL